MIHLIKFAHILIALGLLGLTAYCTTLSRAAERANLLCFMALLAFLTGSLLVYPKHYTFHTPWIQAAYLLLIVYGFTLKFSTVFLKKITQTWIWRSLYVTLITMLILIIHDAVTKNTVLDYVL